MLPTSGCELQSMLKLPDELLLCIAVKLVKNTDLRRLALVNKKLKDVAQEALVKEVLMPHNGIVKLLETLCGRPDLLSKIKSVDLGGYQMSLIGVVSENNNQRLNIYSLDKLNLFRRLRSVIDATNGDGLFARIIAAIGRDQGSMWTPSHQYFLDILVALSPNLRELTIRLPERSEDGAHLLQLLFNEQGVLSLELVDPFQGPASQLLQQRLRVLTLSSATRKSLRTHNITLRSLAQLVRLTIPMDALIFPTLVATDPVMAFPASLECIHIRPCNKNLVLWIPEFASAYIKEEFPKLKKLELSFESCLRSSLLLICQGTDVLPAFRNVMYLLRDNGLTITTFRGDGTAAGDLMEELAAWSCLSHSEACWAATKGMQFSTAVARTDSGAPRERTKAEKGLFLRGTQESVKLRRICRFAPHVNLSAITSVAFGKDKKPKIHEEKCVLDTEEWAKVLSHYDLPTNTKVTMIDDPRPSGIPRLKLTTTYEKVSFSLPFDTPPSDVTTWRFDANEWLGSTFFTREIDRTSDTVISLRPKKRASGKNTPAAVRRRSRTPPVRRMKQKVA